MAITEASAIATSKNGTLMTRSMMRLSTVSTTPPKNPAIVPTITPIAEAISDAITPTSSETLAP